MWCEMQYYTEEDREEEREREELDITWRRKGRQERISENPKNSIQFALKSKA